MSRCKACNKPTSPRRTKEDLCDECLRWVRMDLLWSDVFPEDVEISIWEVLGYEPPELSEED